MKTILFVVLLVAASFAGVRDEGVKRSHALLRDSIPRFQVKNATFEEAFATIQAEWAQSHPGEAFPVELTHFEPAPGLVFDAVPRVSLTLSSVSYIECLRYIAVICGRQPRLLFSGDDAYQVVTNGGARVQLRTNIPDTNFVTRVHLLSEKALAALGLNARSSSADLRTAFEQFGVHFEDWMQPTVLEKNNVSAFIVTSTALQHEHITGILFLLGNGYRITK